MQGVIFCEQRSIATKSGFLEVPFSCVRCETSNPIYDTVLFVNKLLEQFFARRNELNALRTSSLQPQDAGKHSNIVDIHNSDWLSLETQQRP